jgi:hypothetical protein
MEDHFVSFIVKNGNYYDAPLAAQGMGHFIDKISETGRIKIEFKLAYSTSFSSRVILPDQLIGRPLFNYTKKSKNIFSRLFDWTVQQSLTDEVVEFIKKSQKK